MAYLSAAIFLGWRAEKREKIEISGQPGFEPGMSDYEPNTLPLCQQYFDGY
jgi:hypothetical protein